jgi:hypothetical protein
MKGPNEIKIAIGGGFGYHYDVYHIYGTYGCTLCNRGKNNRIIEIIISSVKPFNS